MSRSEARQFLNSTGHAETDDYRARRAFDRERRMGRDNFELSSSEMQRELGQGLDTPTTSKASLNQAIQETRTRIRDEIKAGTHRCCRPADRHRCDCMCHGVR